MEQIVICPFCDSKKVVIKEHVEDVNSEFWIYKCNDCKKFFNDDDVRIKEESNKN